MSTCDGYDAFNAMGRYIKYDKIQIKQTVTRLQKIMLTNIYQGK